MPFFQVLKPRPPLSPWRGLFIAAYKIVKLEISQILKRALSPKIRKLEEFRGHFWKARNFIVYIKLVLNYKNQNIYLNLTDEIPRFC